MTVLYSVLTKHRAGVPRVAEWAPSLKSARAIYVPGQTVRTTLVRPLLVATGRVGSTKFVQYGLMMDQFYESVLTSNYETSTSVAIPCQ